jgi:membrane protease YdiL (CAAX protease family)
MTAIELAAPPGPGLPEACGWTALVLLGQFIATLALVFVAVVVMVVVKGGPLPRSALDFRSLSPDLFAVLSGLPGFLAYLVLIPLACWRISPSPLRKLNFSRPSLTQFLIVCSCVLPLGFLSDALYSFVQPFWDSFLDQHNLSNWKDMGLEQTMSQLNGASLPLLLFFLAVVPAVGEEWMLRGLIGRGLVARWGIVPGVLLTSVLFAGMHLDPPHVAAVFPIGVIMHYVYLTTRSFWMPILYHFLNNATVSIFTALGAAGPGEPPAESGFQTWLKILAFPYLAVAMGVLWKLRTRYVTADGGEARREYCTLEHLPETAAQRIAPNHALGAAVFGLFLGTQVALLAIDVWTVRLEQTAPAEEHQLHPARGSLRPAVLD